MSDSFSSSHLKPPANAPTGPKKLRFQAAMAPRTYLQPTGTPDLWTRNRTNSPSNQRQTSSPLIHSPLQKSFEPDMSKSEPNSPTNTTPQDTPSRRSRFSEGTRPRGESRSASVPIVIRVPQDSEDDNESSGQQSVRSSSRPDSRAGSPLPSPATNQLVRDHRSVKHLTCFWWWEKGECKYSDEDCLYAHEDTGHYTHAPRQLTPGEPAKAGKSLERALNKIAFTNRSTASLASLGAVQPPEADTLSVSGGAISMPDTPFSCRSRSSRAGTPSPRASVDFGYSAQLRNDNDFLRGLVQESQREKRTLLNTVEDLQSEKVQLTTNLDKVKEDCNNLLRERDALQATVRMLQFPTGSTIAQHRAAVSMRSPSAATGPGHNPWGAIGSSRANVSSWPNTPTETPAESPVLQQRHISNPCAAMSGRVSGTPSANTSPPGHAYGGSSTLNPTAPAYGIRLGQNGGNTADNNGPVIVNGASFNANQADGQRRQRELLGHLGLEF